MSAHPYPVLHNIRTAPNDNEVKDHDPVLTLQPGFEKKGRSRNQPLARTQVFCHMLFLSNIFFLQGCHWRRRII